MADFYTQVIAPATQRIRDRPPSDQDSLNPKEDPPIFLIPMDPLAYINFFDGHLSFNGVTVRNRVNRALGWIPPAAPPPRPVIISPDPDYCLTMDSEGDVVRSAQLALIAPVESIVRRLYNLHGDPTINGGNVLLGVTDIWSTAEETTNQNRTDLAWYATVNGETRCVLVLEFKKRGTLNLKDWIPCLGNIILPQNWDSENINNEMAATHTPIAAKLTTDGQELAKQVVRYQTSIKGVAPRRVLLFDYQSLCVLQFPFSTPTKYKKALGFVWQTEVVDAWGGLRNTQVFNTLTQQNNTLNGKVNTIGFAYSGTANMTAVNQANARAEPAVAAGAALPGGSFREMLLMCLIDGIENPLG